MLSHDLSSIHFENFEGPSSLLHQNSLLLAELKKKNSFSRKSSSNLQLAPPFNLFSRNPSMDGSSFLIPQRLPSESSYRLDYPEGLDSFSIWMFFSYDVEKLLGGSFPAPSR